MGISGFLGVVLALSNILQPVSPKIIIALFLLSGFVGTARIKQDSHTLGQVLAGWVLGFVISYLTMAFLSTGILI
jgi:membrane-associated phospholipid phosphatase